MGRSGAGIRRQFDMERTNAGAEIGSLAGSTAVGRLANHTGRLLHEAFVGVPLMNAEPANRVPQDFPDVGSGGYAKPIAGRHHFWRRSSSTSSLPMSLMVPSYSRPARTSS